MTTSHSVLAGSCPGLSRYVVREDTLVAAEALEHAVRRLAAGPGGSAGLVLGAKPIYSVR
jgi:hypothetical protein